MKVKSYFLSVWDIIDPIYFSFTRLTYLDHRSQENIFRVRLTKYKGKNVTLSDGTVIRKNDVLVKIHLHNVALLKKLLPVASDVKRGRLIYRAVERSLPELARYVANHPNSDQIKGIVGITTMNRGCERLGFEIVDISSIVYKALKWIRLMPIHLLSVSRPFKTLGKHEPKYLFMSKPALLQKTKN